MTITTYHGDCRAVLTTLPDRSVHAFITSPPYYGLRAYNAGPGEIGNEPSPELYIAALVEVFREARRVLRDDGVVLCNLGDSYAGSTMTGGTNGKEGGASRINRMFDRNTSLPPGYKSKDLLMLPFRVALALQADGWYVRSVMPWIKRNVMPESVTDRPTTAHEYIFLLAKSARYYWDGEAIRQTNSRPRDYPTWEQRKADGAPMRRGDPGESGDVCHWSGLGGNPAGRNYRTSDPYLASLDLAIEAARAELAHLEAIKARGGMLCDVDADPLSLLVNTAAFKGSHYATFPIKLVEPLLLASVPRECCSVCGAPWVRQIEKVSHSAPVAERHGRQGHNGTPPQQSGHFWQPPDVTDRGFIPSCSCGAPTAPGVVADCFAGSGTVGRVAIEHGRNAVLIELNPEYITDHIEQRTDKVQVRLPLD